MKCTIGLDFGTLSVRGVLVDIATGNIIEHCVSYYKHGVMDEYLNNDIKLPKNFALQNANDYIESMKEVVINIIDKMKIKKDDIIGIGVDFTSSTILPITKDGLPLSNLTEFKDNPHAYVKLWKHHSAEEYAIKITNLAIDLNEPWIKRYGNKISSEWMLPKVYEILDNDSYVFDKTDYFIEAGDFITLYLTGNLVRSSCQAGYKGLWNNVEGYPNNEYLSKLDSRLVDIFNTKLSGHVKALGEKQGILKEEISCELGLNRIPVAVAVIDAHVAAPACDAINAGDMLMIMGTSSCDIVLSNEEKFIPGIQGVVKDGAIPNLYAYESGQPAVGDIFSWFINNNVPKSYYEESEECNMDIYKYMEYKINQIPKSKPRLLALDWWNGNRSLLVNPDLTGLILGFNLQTKPEDIYRALIEATAFGKRMIVEAYESSGIKINRLIACGGLATKNKYLLQCYANILQRPIYYSSEEYAPSLGAAIFGAIVANDESIDQVVKNMSKLSQETIKPNLDYCFDNLYNQYKQLHDYFGINTNIMKSLLKQE